MGQSLTEQVYEKIKNEIITCKLAPNQQIAQPELADKYRVGITPIREALQRLKQEGLVQPIPRFGYIVAPITLSDVNEIFQLRSILESAAARLAAEYGSTDQLAKISTLADYTYVYKDADSYVRFLANNTEFHLAVAAAAGNRRLVEQISKLLDALMRVFHLGLDTRDSAEEMRAEHKALASALGERNAGEAERIAQAQITGSHQRVVDALVSVVGSGTSPFGQAVQIRPT